MKQIWTFLLGFSALSGTSAVNRCLDPTHDSYVCDGSTPDLWLFCGITDEDVDALASCFDVRGRETITELQFERNVALTTLPEDLFEGFTALKYLNLCCNGFTTLPEGIFGNLTTVTSVWLHNNSLTTLPEEIFEEVTALENLQLYDNGLSTLPEGIFQDLDALENLGLEGNCLESLPIIPEGTSVEGGVGLDSDECDVVTPAPATPASSDSTPIAVGVVAAVAALALAGFLAWRRHSHHKTHKTSLCPVAPPAHHHHDDGMQSRPEHSSNAAAAAEDVGAGLADEEDTGAASVATAATTADMSTAERGEVSQFRQRQCAAEGEQASGGGCTDASPAASRESSASDIRLGQAVLAAAQELARSCQIPGVSEAAGAVCTMANLFMDSRENDKASTSRLRQCRSMVLALKRANKVVDKGGDTVGEAARVLIEDVHDAIFDLVELIKTFQTKNKLSRLFLSTLFKRRQEELDAVVNQAIMRLQLGLQLQAGQDISAVKNDVSAVKENLSSVKEGMGLYQRSVAEATSVAVAEDRRIKRQRKLDQAEIPEEHLSITDELLGKGGFGEVYLADYNGHNAAAKVLHIAHDLGAFDENLRQRETGQRRAFLRELEAMIRLRSVNTVNVYGAVTSLPDRMVLVMELLAGGDLLTLLRNSETPLPEERSRSIIRDVCAGMAFLHSKNTTHGDLKSANVLLDGDGRAKIADFGTSRWTQHTTNTGLATYTTKSSQSTQMSVPWTAPEVLDSEGTSYSSDVYSFGIVVWEVMSRKLPWANKTRPSEIMFAVMKGTRPTFSDDAPADIVAIAEACWCGEPKKRTTFRAVLEGMKTEGWGDE